MLMPIGYHSEFPAAVILDLYLARHHDVELNRRANSTLVLTPIIHDIQGLDVHGRPLASGPRRVEVAQKDRWTSELILPLYIVLASGCVLLLHFVSTATPLKKLFGKRRSANESTTTQPINPSTEGLVEEVKAHVLNHGGTRTFVFYLVRLACTLALLGLAMVSLVHDVEEGSQPGGLGMLLKKKKKKKKHPGNVSEELTMREWLEFAMCLTFLYTFILAIISVCTRPRWSRVVIRHLNTVLLATLGIYAYRDIYPLATFNKTPLDIGDGWLVWSKVALLFVAAVAVPLFIPRRYTPYNPKNPSPIPNPEQTASLFSLYFYFFMDPVIFSIRKNEHLPYDKLPPLPDYDAAENLRERAFRHLDPTLQPKRRHLFFSLMRVLYWEYLVLALTLIVQVFTGFSTPFAVKGLLSYLEQTQQHASGSGTMRPWVWIAIMFIGPTISSLAFEWYIYVATHILVQVESVLTQVIFEHALRIRLKMEVEGEGTQTPTKQLAEDTDSTKAGSSREATLVPSDDGNDNGSVESSAAPTVTEAVTSHVQEETLVDVETTASSSGAKLQPPSPTPDSHKKPSDNVVGLPSSTKPKADGGNMVGKITNLVSTDLQTVIDSRDFIRLFVYTPIQLVLCVTFLYFVLGWSAFVGLGIVFLSLPLPGVIASMVRKVQARRMKETDARVQAVTEIMNVIRMVKMFGWEQKMNSRVTEKREKEMYWIWRLRFLHMATNITKSVCLSCTDFCEAYAPLQLHHSHVYDDCDVCYLTLLMKEQLDASKVFSSMVVFGKFQSQLANLLWTLNQSMTAKVSLDRITDFLYDTELLDSYSKDKSKPNNVAEVRAENEDERSKDIGFRSASFSWSLSQGSETPNKRRFVLRIDGELLFKQGSFNLVIGPTGCGKTSLLMALLSEMHFTPDSLDSWYNLPRDKGVAYAAQESWVLNATIKDNILFGAPLDEARYKKVLYQCSLEQDLKLFGAGDMTEVGEKGVTLSGGQKARVTLARAIYSRADTLLLDDVLAALDVHTSKWIVEKCFKGDLVRGRTVILVTHNVAMVQPLADYVISLSDGRVASQGSISDALSKDKKLAAEVKLDEEIEHKADEVIDVPSDDTAKSDGKLILAEEVELGHLGWPALKLWLHSLGGRHYVLFYLAFVGCLMMNDVIDAVQVWYLGHWAEQYNERPPEEVNAMHYLGVYGGMILFLIFGYCIVFAIYLNGTMRASRSIHKQLVESILGTTMRWLDRTPTSRVITRCTQDIRDSKASDFSRVTGMTTSSSVDDSIAQMFAMLLAMTSSMLMKFCAVVLFTPAFLGPAVLVTVTGIWCGQIYIRSQMAVKREMANAKAPVLGHFGSAIAGLTSIRAYAVEEDFKTQFRSRIDHYTRPARTFYNLNRWIDVRIDAIGNLFASALAIYLVYVGKQTPSNTGYSLNMAGETFHYHSAGLLSNRVTVGFSGMILWWIRFVNMFEIRGNSLERINGYINIEHEPKPTSEGKPPAYWPASGELRVESLAAKYSQDGPKVLKDISFSVKAGERIGVVGRTGSGKSSLMLSLLRCILTEGEVYYDGLPTSKLNLEDLRSNITIIPQMPELISGSVRENLDPFGQHDDATLNDALRASGLFSLQHEGDQDRITLESAIASGGNNLSVGQRQILALARAIVRGSKLFILDEATSAIDYNTDSIIQNSLRRELGKDVTLITVAHRLQTIMDADKILVLDEGSIAEFDSPQDLLEIEGGKLRRLVDESGDKEHLYKMARRH
ncbi:hypothetical protein V5O48_016710 [Marasmius crinis-equi]|uniref:P-loop containing nucleoside triphosphate hydrolase protein n=1 Tax=Marasmius crinis-equi TaxID=585013 RepID=A0ABR3ER35_9AGAR